MRIDIRSPEFTANPHRYYALLRQRRPVCPFQDVDGARSWLVTRYDDVQALLRDQRLTREPPPSRRELPQAQARVVEYLETHLLNRDRPVHARLRRLIARPLSAPAAQKLRPTIAARAARLLDAFEGKSRMDVIADYAFPLTVGVIGNLLGLPEESWAYIRHWYDLEAVTPFVEKIEDAVQARRIEPRDDLISQLVAARAKGELDETELIGTILFLYIAGHETTMNAIGNAVLTLLIRHEARRAMEQNPERLPDLLEEILRYEGSVERAWVRWAQQDMMLRDQEIRQGDRLLLAVAAANRDPAVFKDPDQICPGRRETAHLSFGSGHHFCAGAALGREVLQIAVSSLFNAFPTLFLAVSPEELMWVREDTMRGVVALPVQW